MATAYLFNMPYHGHVNPCLPLIEELRRRGDRVVLYGTENFRSAVEAAGGEFRSFEHEEQVKGVALSLMAEWQMQTIERHMPQLIRDAAKDPPDYAIVDYSCVWGRVFAQHLKLKTVVLHTTCPIVQSTWQMVRGFVREIRAVPWIWRKWLAFALADWRIALRWRVPRIGSPFRMLNAEYGDLHLVLASPQMVTSPRQLDERYVFVGPSIRRSGLSEGEPLPDPDERPLIYLSLGTHWRHPADIYLACAKAFADAPVRVLIAGSARIAPEVLQALPSNFHVRAYVDQIEVLRRAAVFITHGGMNSVCESLTSEVPLLVHPQGFDQFLQASYIERSGAGLALKQADVTPERVRSLVDRLMNERSFRERCRVIAGELRDCGGAAKAADVIKVHLGNASTRRERLTVSKQVCDTAAPTG